MLAKLTGGSKDQKVRGKELEVTHDRGAGGNAEREPQDSPIALLLDGLGNRFFVRKPKLMEPPE